MRSEGKDDLQLQTPDGHLRSFLDTEYREIVREKGSYMPALKSTAEERRDLIAYLSRLDGVPVGASRTERPQFLSARLDRSWTQHPANGRHTTDASRGIGIAR